MKKAIKVLSVGLLSAAVIASASLSASAAGLNAAEQKILNELKTSVTMNGMDKQLPVSYINQAENYFNTVEITDEQANEIVKRIESTKEYLTSTQAANYEDLSDTQIDTFIAKCNDIVDVINAKLLYDKATRTVTIIDKDGNTIFTASNVGVNGNPNNDRYIDKTGNNGNSGNSGNNGSQSVINDNPIKVTGFDFNIPGVMSVAGAGVLLVSAAGVYLVSTKKKAAVHVEA